MAEKGNAEKRKYIRIDSETKVNFHTKEGIAKKGPSDKTSALIKNLSVEGICFASDKQIEKGTFLALEVFLPSQKQPLHLDGKVAWSKPAQLKKGKEAFDIGVKLFTIEKGDENKFIGYVCDKMMHHLSKYLHL
ncbi:MAG: PilZ domain-containing protein [Candidatus Omnitrophica bacterium]|nr:PilZ domain-containing protein [Candidatus Omnitrophota bacterium]